MPPHRPDGYVPVLPPEFRFGTCTSAYQVEGAAAEDGRGPSIWDSFARLPRRVVDGSTGDVAADQYHRLDEDVALLSSLGAVGHRFSFSWSRIQPTGKGPVNRAGLDYYDRLVDRLLEADLQPMATLFHWDLPEELEADGGWLNRATIDHFAEYAALLGARFADRVTDWVPVNAPNIVTLMGYATGVHAPGRSLGFDALPVAHHLLLAHGRAAIELRAAGATSIGCANHHSPMWPASDRPEDVGATKIFDALWNGMFLEPMLLGRYPVDLAPLLEEVVEPGDMAIIRQPLDFYGVSFYRPMKVGASAEDADLPFELLEPLGYPTTDAGWVVVPDALREWLIMFRARFRAALPPIVITECGAAYDQGPDEDGVVHDEVRIDYLRSHLVAVEEAIQRGVDIRGFYVWSLLDGFTWTYGLTQRYGLVHVDFETLERTPKKSFSWFGEMIARQPRSVG